MAPVGNLFTSAGRTAEIFVYPDAGLASGPGAGTDQSSENTAAFVPAWCGTLCADLFAGRYGQCVDILSDLCQHDICFRPVLEISGIGIWMCGRLKSGGVDSAAGLPEKQVFGFGRSGKRLAERSLSAADGQADSRLWDELREGDCFRMTSPMFMQSKTTW